MSTGADKWQVVIFDFFGVLCSDLVDHWINRRGLQDQAAMLRDTYVRPADLGRHSFDELCRGLGSGLSLDGALVRHELLELSTVDQDAVSLFKELGTRKKLAICSNAPRGLVAEVITYRSMNLPCEITVSSADVGVAKPDTAIYHKVLDLVHCDAAHAIMIDDRPVNVRGAEAIGMTGLQFSSVPNLRAQLMKLGVIQ
jgi:putative hydrolase of the HAD superfamily